MNIDTDKATLALLYESAAREGGSSPITEPVSKAKSGMLTDEGLRQSERLFRDLFGR